MPTNNTWCAWSGAFVPAATYYLDPVAGNDSHAGTSPATAWLTYAKAEQQALSVGQSIVKKISGAWILFKSSSATKRSGVVLSYFLGDSTMPVSAIDFGALTHVAHDHIEPHTDGSLDVTTRPITTAGSAALIAAARAAGVKTLLTVADIFGGDFPGAVSGALSTLVKNLVRFVCDRGYDGIDIDWERNMSTAGVVALMSALYPALKAQNPNFIVNMAQAYTNENGTVVTDRWAAVAQFTDTVNVMAYDLYTPAGLTTWHDAALFDGNLTGFYQQELLSSFRCVRGFVSAGVPAAKLLLGIPFYGRLFSGNVGTPTSGPLTPRQTYPSAGSMVNTYLLYNQIPPYYVAADDMWDALSQVPFLSLVNGTPALNSYLTYDDPSSVTAKVEWAIAKGLGGVAIWELDADYFSARTIKCPLLDAVKCSYPKVGLAAGATPATVGAVTAQSVSTSSVTLNWTPVPAATNYLVKRSTTSGSGYTTLATGIVTGTTFTDATVSSGVTYYYVVAAVTNGTAGANSAQTSVVASALTPPATPTALAAGTVTTTSVVNVDQVTLTWTGSASSYLVKRSTMVNGSCYVIVATVASATFTDTSLAAGVTYYYVVSAVVAGLESANSAQASAVGISWNATNLLSSPADITAAGWSVGGTGVSATNATTLACASAGVSSLMQTSVAVSPSTSYIATATIVSATAGFVTLSVYAPGWTPIPASQGAWVTAGQTATFNVPFNTSGNSTVIFELDFSVDYIGASVTVSASSLSVAIPGSTNILTSPNAINISPWVVSGIGVSATSATTLLAASSGGTSLAQTSVAVVPNTAYTATLTLASSSASGFATLTIFAPAYASTLAHSGNSLLTTNVTLTVNFNSGAYSSVVFELDATPDVGATLTISASALSVTPPWVSQW